MSRDNFNKINEEYFNTILDESFGFKGTIKFDTSCIIKGFIEGKIESTDKLVIGPNAVINADIIAKSLECFGKINGNVSVKEEAYFHAPSFLTGSINVPLLTFEKGCILNGYIKMTDENDIINDNNKQYLNNKNGSTDFQESKIEVKV
jgi:cytoskeletal protein CcmA (bactofilin family)